MAKKEVKQPNENDLVSDFNWDEENKESVPKITKPEEPKEESTDEKPISKATAFDNLRKELIKLRDRFRLDYQKQDKDIDIEIMYMQGIGVPRGYIIRSMDLSDIEEIENATQDECNNLLDQLKAEATEKGIATSEIFITERDREDIYRNLVVKTCTLYPENFTERVMNKKVRPGDLSEIYKTAMSFSGFFAPVFEIDDEVQDPNEFLANKFASNSQLES